MIISLNWLKKFGDFTMPVEELTGLIGSRLVEIESVINLGERYERIVVVDIKEVSQHPNADKLAIYYADDGGVTSGVERRPDGFVQVISGDMSLKAGDKVAWLPPGSTVPDSYATTEPFVLSSREMRGQISHGMFGSGKELGINNDAARVAVLDTGAPAGTSFADAYELNDYLLDIENKSLTHRPDCFGLVGFAREVAGIQGVRFTTPDWLRALEPVLGKVDQAHAVENPIVTIEDNAMCPRYEAVVIADIDATRQSPLIIQSYLKRLGVRPINMVVDITNYLMLVTGHPLHAFDYDALIKAQGGGEVSRVTVRGGKTGEKLTLLDGRTIELAEDDITICAGDTPVGLAGAMGGADTEVTENTKTVLLESATFNLYNLRSTAMRHGVFSEAATRFTKGQPAAQTAPVLASAVRMLCDMAGGKRVSDVIDVYPSPGAAKQVSVALKDIESLLGIEVAMKDITDTLLNVECGIDVTSAHQVHVTPPYWRTDLHIPEDVIEEIGRLRGYDTIDPTLPRRPYTPVTASPYDQFKFSLRQKLATFGANEVLTYSFVPAQLLHKAAQDPDHAFRIVNAISPDLQYYRTSLWPSLLEKTQLNIKAHEPEFAIFELNKVHVKGLTDPADSNLPIESSRLGFVVATNDRLSIKKYDGAAYYHARAYLDTLLGSLRVPYSLVQLDTTESSDPALAALAAPFEPKRSAVVKTAGGQVIGVIGEPTYAVQKEFKLPKWCSGFELMVDGLFAAQKAGSGYVPLSRYPGTERDMTFKVGRDITYAELADAVTQTLDKSSLRWLLQPIDIYEKDDVARHITVRISLTKLSSTITAEEANRVISDITTAAHKALQATVV